LVDILFCSAAVIGIIIFVHELGHFAAAKCCGIRIITLSVGFGPRIWKRQIGETLYCLSAIPLGGYVRPFAAVEDALLPKGKRKGLVAFLLPLAPEEAAIFQRLSASDPGNLLQKSFLARAAFILGGTAFNCIFAVFILTLWLWVPTKQLRTSEPKVESLMKSSPAGKAGLLPGDLIEQVNGVPVPDWQSFTRRMQDSNGAEVTFIVARVAQGKLERLPIQFLPRKVVTHRHGAPETAYIGGFRSPKVEGRIPFWLALRVSVTVLWKVLQETALGDGANSKKTALREASEQSTVGFIEGALNIGLEASGSVGDFICTLAFLSLAIGLLNLLPAPALDGGALATLVLQKVFRVPISVVLEQQITYCGLLLILLLTAFRLSADFAHSLRLLFT
jgi:regulator of sigma E protease